MLPAFFGISSLAIAMPANTYYGTIELQQQHLGLRLSTSRYPADATIPAHEHANTYICIPVAGGFLERSGRNEHAVHAHDPVYHPAGHRHADRFHGSGGRCLNFEITPEWFPAAAGIRMPAAPIYANGPALRRIGRALVHAALQPDGPAGFVLDTLLLDLLAQLRGPASRRHGRPPPWLLAVRDRLRETCGQAHQLADLAAAAGVHPVHLAREFQRQFGCTAHAWLRRCRIEAATVLLAGGDRPLVDIALELGFNNQSHFTRVFVAHTGVSPGAYRRQAHARKR